jgi:hypothetical protein
LEKKGGEASVRGQRYNIVDEGSFNDITSMAA